MAKTQIKNYIFKPGLGYLENLYTNAYELLKNNKEFLLQESINFINKEIINADKCQRDIGYILDGLTYDIILGTNYNARFLGITEVNSLDLSNTVKRTILRAKDEILLLGLVANNSLLVNRVNDFFDEILNIINNGRSASSVLTFTNLAGIITARKNAKDLILANIDFITAEINAWVAFNYPDNNHDVDKCTRDIKYALESLAYDIIYDGNSATYDQSKFFFYNTSANIPGITDEHRNQTISGYERLKSIVPFIIRGINISKTDGNDETQVITSNIATSAESDTISDLIDIIIGVVSSNSISAATSFLNSITKTYPNLPLLASSYITTKNQLDTNKSIIISNVTWKIGYTYDQNKCTRDLGFILDAYLICLRYGGNEKLVNSIKYYWQNDIAQVDGNRIPEIDTHLFIGDLIKENILLNTAYQTSSTIQQTIDLNLVSESDSFNLISTYVQNTVDVIKNGLSSMPVKVENGMGKIFIQGRYKLEDFLLITNTTKNEIIYNFGNPSLGGNIEYKTDNLTVDEYFPTFLQTTDAITILYLNYGTNTHLSTDSLQIFSEYGENGKSLIYTRPYNFGTDAIERMRIAPPLSMLDADFEYGLQPTKWAAISTLRGYPSVYEIPGTDTPVFTIVTDASTGTEGVGQSLITVTTVGPHGLVTGNPITIKALEDNVVGSARAEGSFVVISVPTLNTFTYYAKSKVGTTDGQVLSNSYTQLRKAGFYSGASIGNPVFNVVSQGSSGELVSPFDVEALEFRVPFIGTVPTVGSPIQNSHIPLGSQVTNVNSVSDNGGIYITPIVLGDYFANTSPQSITVENPTGIIDDLAVDNGDGTAMFVESISGNDIIFTDIFQNDIIGNKTLYENISGNNFLSTGLNATFDITPNYQTVFNNPTYTINSGTGQITDFTVFKNISSGVYNVVIRKSSGWTSGNSITITGTNLDGTTPANDLDMQIDTVDNGSIIAVTISGTANISGPPTDSYVVVVNQAGSGYTVGDKLFIRGENLQGTTPENDLNIIVDSIDTNGEILTITTSGIPYTGTAIITDVVGVIGGNQGSGSVFDVVFLNNVYTSVVISSTLDNSVDYTPKDIILIDGITQEYDIYVKVDEVDGDGVPTNFTWTGIAPDAEVAYNNPSYTSNNQNGSLDDFTVTRTGTVYSVQINTSANWISTDLILITGDNLGGSSPTNDLVITVDTIGSGGSITGTSLSGTSINTDSFSRNGSNVLPQSATFDVEYENNIFINVDIPSPDTSIGYHENDILKISGNLFNGEDTQNDLFITVTAVGDIGNISSFSFDGVAPDGVRLYTDPLYSTNNSGTITSYIIDTNGNNYNATFLNTLNFAINDTITILGTSLDGASPTNDLVITVNTIGLNGEIETFSLSGTARNYGYATSLEPVRLLGTGSNFTISIADGLYSTSVSIIEAGFNYYTNHEIYVRGRNLLGNNTSDIIINVVSVDANLSITSASISANTTGTATVSSKTNLSTLFVPQLGNNSSFNVYRADETYAVTLDSAGSDYAQDDRIIIIGSTLGGIDNTHDLLITIETVGINGEILTFSTSYSAAYSGDSFDLYSTFIMSEPISTLLPANDTITFDSLASVEIYFEYPHGLVPGDTFITGISSDDAVNNHNLAAGSFFVSSVPSLNTLRFESRAPGYIDNTFTNIIGDVYPRPDSFFIHRPYDGGVQLGTGGPQHGAQAIRQSKKYIRYQSGKGIMYTTGALFAPSYDLRSVTASGIEVGSIITIVTDDNDHGVQEGGIIRLLGIETEGYNSGSESGTPPEFDYTVTEVIDERTFKVRAQRRLGNTTAVLGFSAQMSVVSWHGATVRSGVFDDQNGIFWEYDGTQISVAQRTGTKQLAGTVTIGTESNKLEGLNTRFRDQIKAGDKIIIKGMTHVVSQVASDTVCYITPDWRGVSSITAAKANLIVDKKVKQSEFNLDKLDGTGPSGYKIDVAKMQMIGIQYSWYGAGFIDFMLRGQDGNFIFAHRMRNSNVNTEAFMRSGNLPVRYEVSNEGPSGRLKTDVDATQTYLELYDTSFFPDSGYLYIDNEIIHYLANDKLTNTLTNCVRQSNYSNYQAGANRTYTAGSATTHSAKTGVILLSLTITPLISHWGSAFLTDGGFDEDRGYIFSYVATGVTTSTTKQTAFLIRLAPSVSNAITGDLGERELLNRAQLLLQGIEITSDASTGGIVIEGILNPKNYPLDPSDISWSGLTNEAQGGQPSFAQIALGGSINWGATTDVKTATVSTDIDTGFIYNPSNNSRSSPLYFTKETTATNPIILGTEIFSQNPNIFSNGNTFVVYSINNYSSVDYDYIYFRYWNGSRFIYNTGSPGYDINTNIKFVYRTFIGKTNRILFTKASWDACGATVGTKVSTTDTNWPAGTAVSNVELKKLAQTEFYEVLLSQVSINDISAGNTVSFDFGTAGYALPGETVFSFIANPGERSDIGLEQLKELTNTPLGGRGTYPNGPDVLAINVYKITGSSTSSNIILKWGEAQA